MNLSWIWQKISLKNELKNWNLLPFYKRNPSKTFGWFLIQFWRNTSVKRISFVVGWVGGILCFVHTPVLRCPCTRTALGLRLRFARISVNAQFWMSFFWRRVLLFLRAPFFVCLTSDFWRCLFFGPYLTVLYFFTFIFALFCLFFVPFISHNLTNSNIFFRILNAV